MSNRRSLRRRRRALALPVLILPSLIICAAAIAAQPLKGRTYAGTINQVFNGKVVNEFPFSFGVSANGKKVKKFNLGASVPIYCEGGGFGGASGGSATVTKAGTFKAKLPIIFTPTHEHQGFVTITGKFGAKGTESGSLSTEFANAKIKSCDGTSRYRTTAQ
jgi:hypothetical protein